MIKSAVCVACVTLLCLGASSSAQADPIKSFSVLLTGGSVVFEVLPGFSAGSFSLEGTAFSMEGTYKTGFGLSGLGTGFVEPLMGCFVCAPGDQIGTSVGVSGWEPGASVYLDGQSYTLGPVGPDAGAYINIGGGPITVPAFRPYAVVATTSIGLQGGFAGDLQGGLGPFADIFGDGRVSLTFAPASEKGLWDLRGIRYDFGPTPTPTPEPATLTLVSGAVVAAAIRARTRRARRTRIQLSTSTPTT